MKIIILIPIYNDWQSATKLLENINNEVSGIDHTFSIILVNDASTEQITENTSNFSNLNSVQILNLKQNIGHARCIATGLNHIIKNEEFDYVIPMDGDGEDRPEEIKLFIENFNYHPNKTIVGERVKRSESILFKLCYSFHKILTYTFTGQSIKFGNYTCLTKSTIEKMLTDKATWSSFSGSLAKNCNDRAAIASERGKRIKEIAKNQKNFNEAPDDYKASNGDLVTFDYKATVDGKDFQGSEGKNTQLEIGKDLFIKGFDKNLLGVKKNDTKDIETTLPENYPQKDLSNKKAKFSCKILTIKKPTEVQINDDFAKNLGAKDLNNLKEIVSKQINDEYSNSLENLSKNQILKQLEKFKVDQIPQNLIDQEIKILSQGMSEEEAKKNKDKFEQTAKKRIKLGLILNEFGEQNKIKVEENEIRQEIEKQLKMMPGQEKMVMEYYQKNPSATASLRGTIYEDKIIKQIKQKAKSNIKNISKEEAEKLLKSANDNMVNDNFDTTESPTKKTSTQKKAKTISKKAVKPKKVSKK